MTAPENVISLEGEIDLHASPRIAGTLHAALKEKPRSLVIDLSKVSYIDSSGLTALLESMQAIENYGGKFALAGLPDNVKPIFEISHLDKVFRIFPDVASASAAN